MALSASDDDIMKLLENSPTLKALLDLPARVAALEAKVRELESGRPPAPAPVLRPGAKPCPFCHGPLKLMTEVDHPEFGFAGLKVRTYECESCHRVTTRDYDPRKDGP